MKILKNMRMDFYKILTGYGFYLCIIFMVFLCFASEIYKDYETLKQYSCFSVLCEFSKDFMLTDTQFCSLSVLNASQGSWLSLFIPIVSAFAFVPLFCDEYEAKSIRLQIFRSSKFSFNLSRFITGCLCGGLAIVIGFGIFAAIEYQLFPDISEYDESLRQMFSEYNDTSSDQVIKKFGDMFLYGVLWTAPTIMLTSLIRNKYLVMCIPFFIKYGLNQTSTKLLIKALNNDDFNYELLRKVHIFSPDSLCFLNQYKDEKNYILLYSLGIIIVCAVLYIIFQGKKVDSGE